MIVLVEMVDIMIIMLSLATNIVIFHPNTGQRPQYIIIWTQNIQLVFIIIQKYQISKVLVREDIQLHNQGWGFIKVFRWVCAVGTGYKKIQTSFSISSKSLSLQNPQLDFYIEKTLIITYLFYLRTFPMCTNFVVKPRNIGNTKFYIMRMTKGKKQHSQMSI